nr:HD domain-containing phosphohydrolase [Geothrix oryzisoli]
MDAVARHELVLEERALLEQALTGSTQILVELLSRLDPRAFGRAEEIRRLALAIARQLGLGAAWDIELSTLLGPIGRLAIPAEVQAKIDRGQGLDERDRELTLRAPEACARLISRIPRLDQVVDIIRYSAKNYDGSGYPDDLRAGKALPVGSRILKVAQDFVDHLNIRDSSPLAYNEIRSKGALNYDPEVVAALGEVLGAEAELRPQAAPARGFPRRWPPPGKPRG